MDQVEQTIAGLRASVGAINDAELARALRVNQSTISSWRARGHVPAKFGKLMELPRGEAAFEAPRTWGTVEDRALAIAHARFVLLRQDIARSRDVEKAIATFLDVRLFWLVLHRAVHDLRMKVASLPINLDAAQVLLLQEDLRDPDATAKRVEAEIAEDVADNPWLKGWK